MQKSTQKELSNLLGMNVYITGFSYAEYVEPYSVKCTNQIFRVNSELDLHSKKGLYFIRQFLYKDEVPLISLHSTLYNTLVVSYKDKISLIVFGEHCGYKDENGIYIADDTTILKDMREVLCNVYRMYVCIDSEKWRDVLSNMEEVYRSFLNKVNTNTKAF